MAAAALVFTLAPALVLVPAYGINGAAVSSTIGYVASALLAVLLFFRLSRTKKAMPRPPARRRLDGPGPTGSLRTAQARTAAMTTLVSRTAATGAAGASCNAASARAYEESDATPAASVAR